MEFRQLDITIISARDLKDVNLFTKMDVYAVVSIKGDPYTNHKLKTPVDKDSGPNPNWNYPIKFTLHDSSAHQNLLTLKIQLKSDRRFGDRDIGEVRVPIKELLENYGKASREEKFLTYAVTTLNGKQKGSLNFSYKFGEKFTAPTVATGAAEKAKHGVGGEPVMAYPATGYSGASASTADYKGHGGYYQQPYPYPPPPQYGYGAYPPPPPAGYGYGGYPAAAYQQGGKKHGGSAGKMALGVGAGLLGGLLVGDMISDVGEMAAYDAGYDDGLDDAGFF